MLSLLVQCLRNTGVTVSIEQLEDIFWLASRWPTPSGLPADVAPWLDEGQDLNGEDKGRADESVSDLPHAMLPAKTTGRDGSKNPSPTELHSAQMSGTVSASTLRVPGVASIRQPADLRRALQPFARRMPSRWHSTLDEEETASLAADTGVWCPVYRPSRERWFEISLVVEESPSMALWQETLEDFIRLLRDQGRFRKASAYRLDSSGMLAVADRRTSVSPERLYERKRPHLILLATDATSPQWHRGAAYHFLHDASATASVSILLVLPRRAWKHTALGEPEVSMFSERAGDATAQLKTLLPWWLDKSDADSSLFVPVLGFDAESMHMWARTMTARGGSMVSGLSLPKPLRQEEFAMPQAQPPKGESPGERISRFRRMVSTEAYELAVFLSVPDPLTVPVMRLIQRTMLPSTGTAELAEFFVGGLLELANGDSNSAMTREPGYRLGGVVRQELERSLRYSEENKINAQLRSVGRILVEEGEQSSNFEAMFPSPSGGHRLTTWSLPFASLSREVILQRAPREERVAPEAPLLNTPPSAQVVSEVNTLAMLTVVRTIDGGRLVVDLYADGVRHEKVESNMALVGDLVRHVGQSPDAARDLEATLLSPDMIRVIRALRRGLVLAMGPGLEFIPWELVLRSEGSRSDMEWFALNHFIIRIPLGMNLATPSTRVPGERHLALVIGDPSGPLPILPQAREEAMAVARVLGKLPSDSDLELILRGSEEEVIEKLKNTPFNVLFVSGHGVKTSTRNGGSLVGVQLGSSRLLGIEELLSKGPPPEIIFLACSYLAELAPGLLKAGVSVVVAAIDTLQDSSAFPLHFFESLLSGSTLAEATLAARRGCFDARELDGDMGWAEYQCYGNPDYRLVAPNPVVEDADQGTAPGTTGLMPAKNMGFDWPPPAPRNRALAIYNIAHVLSNDPPDLSAASNRFLAAGDTWFSIGTLNPAKNSNLLFQMTFSQASAAVNCTSPGDNVGHAVNLAYDPSFTDMLLGRRARIWDALLLSFGGGDLIDAFGTHGVGVPRAKRLLLEPAEWGPVPLGATRYLSDEGWKTFCSYLRANLEHIVKLRDMGPSKGVPIFMHGYAVPTPRPSGAGIVEGPWLYPPLLAYSVPEADWIPVVQLLFKRLAQLLAECADDSASFPNLHFFDTTKIPIEPASLGSTGESGDWLNEIHPTWRGFEKLAIPWALFIEQTLSQR